MLYKNTTHLSKIGFTLIELLIVISIIGILSGVVFTSTRIGIEKAKASNVVAALDLIKKAFIFKALEEDSTIWWPEEDFPDEVNWGASITQMLEEGILNEFLAVAPEIPGNTPDEFNKYDFEFLYDNDGDINGGDAADCWNYTLDSFNNNKKGVSIVINFSYSPTSEKYARVFEYLDRAIDGGDGPYCGLFREQYRADQPNKRGFFRYYIDLNQTPDF